MTDIELILHYIDHPEEHVYDLWRDFFIETRGDNPSKWLDSWVVEVLHALTEHQYVAVTGANAVGKTAVSCFAKYHFLCTREESLVPVTSVDQPHLRSVFWAESRRWYDRSPELQKTFEHTATRVRNKEKPNTWFAEARTARKQSDPGGSGAHAAGLQGFHAEHLLYLLDEGSAVDDVNWESAESSIRKPDQRILVISNPLRVFGRMFEIFHLERYKAIWYTRAISYKESTLIDHDLAEKQIVALGGDESPVAQIRYYGRFPKAGTDDTLPTYDSVQRAIKRTFETDLSAIQLLLEAYKTPRIQVDGIYSAEQLGHIVDKLTLARKFDHPEFSIESLMHTRVLCDNVSLIKKKWEMLQAQYFYHKPRLGVDLARFGSSECVFCVRRGWRVLELLGLHSLKASNIKGRIENYFETYGIEAAIIDATGIAGGILTDFIDTEKYPCVEVAFGGESTNPFRYANLATEMWMTLNENIELFMLPDDEILVSQLTTRKYSYTGKTAQQVIIESKKEMLKRHLPSPDRADALCLAFAPIVVEDLDEEGDVDHAEISEPSEPGVISI